MSICGAGVVVAVAFDPVVRSSAPRLWVVASVEAVCVCEARFNPGKAPKNLFANEPSLSVQGMGGSCGNSGPDPGGNTIASGTMTPGNCAWKILFIPPSSPL